MSSAVCSKLQFCFSVAADVGDTGAEFDRVFLQELRDLKVFVNDREIAEEHRRCLETKILLCRFKQPCSIKNVRNTLSKLVKNSSKLNKGNDDLEGICIYLILISRRFYGFISLFCDLSFSFN